MSVKQWTEAQLLGLPMLDDAHRRFSALLAEMLAAEDDQVEAAWHAVVDCASSNFASEDRWMAQSGFAGLKMHSLQHLVVLQVMREGLVQAGEGKLLQVREMARQLTTWFIEHVQTLDAALALHLRSARFDPAATATGSTRNSPVSSPLIHSTASSARNSMAA